MIHPQAEVVDLDAPLWGALALAVQQSRTRREWAYVLHCDGAIVSTLPAGLHSAPLGTSLEDARALARAVRAETGRPRAVVLDERGLDDLVVTASAAARPERTLAELRAEVAALYWSSPAVATDPPEPPNDPQLRLREALQRSLPTPATALLRIDHGTEFGAAVQLTVAGGLITHCICVDEPTAQWSSKTADIRARVQWDALIDAVASADPWSAFAQILDDASEQRNLDVVRQALLSAAPTT